jgi:hypothetical protein
MRARSSARPVLVESETEAPDDCFDAFSRCTPASASLQNAIAQLSSKRSGALFKNIDEALRAVAGAILRRADGDSNFVAGYATPTMPAAAQ